MAYYDYNMTSSKSEMYGAEMSDTKDVEDDDDDDDDDDD